MAYKIGFCITGSFCTLNKALIAIKQLCDCGHTIIPIFSYSVANIDTRFFTAQNFREQVSGLTKEKIIDTIPDAEPIGPKSLVDIILVAPATGNTLSKICHGITDTPVTMAVKAHLRNNRPVVLSIATNDGLSGNAKNIGELLNRKNIFFVPFRQDDCLNKPNSLISKFELIPETVEAAMKKMQLQPIIV